MTVWGYARVSTQEQDAGLQLEALARAGVDQEHIVVEHVSGARAARPGLDRLLAQLVAGDVLTVWKLDRLGRSVSHLVAVVDELGRRGVEFRSLTDALDTTTASGRMTFVVLAAVAQFERELMVERTKAGLAAARAKRGSLGRPSKVNARQFEQVLRLHGEGMSQRAIAESTGLSKTAVVRVLRGEIASLEKYARKVVGDE